MIFQFFYQGFLGEIHVFIGRMGIIRSGVLKLIHELYILMLEVHTKFQNLSLYFSYRTQICENFLDKTEYSSSESKS